MACNHILRIVARAPGRALPALLLLLALAVTGRAQQPQPANVTFELSANDLRELTVTGAERTSIDIEVKNISHRSGDIRSVKLIIASGFFGGGAGDLGSREREVSVEKVSVEAHGGEQTYPLAEHPDTWFEIQSHRLYLKVDEVKWPNDAGTVTFKGNERGQVSASLSFSLEPANYKVTAKASNSITSTELVDDTQNYVEGEPRTIRLKAPTLLGGVWDKLISLDGLLGSVIVALATILVGVLKDKIKGVFNWTLDFLGKYLGGMLAERRFLRRYIDNLSFNHKYLKLIGFNVAGISRPLLEEVFISLRIASNSAPLGSAAKDAAQDPSAISFNSAFRQHQYMVILGGPGAGKTTTLSYALLMFAQKRAGEVFGIEKDLIPVFIPLRRLSNSTRSIVEDLTDKDTQILSPEILRECPANYFESRLKKGRCLVLLDGLDEVTDEKTHRQVSERINSLVAAYPDNRFVVTCRVAGWKDLLSGEFKVLLAQDFNRDEIQRFVLGWHRAVITQSESSRLQLDIPDKKKFEEVWEVRKEQFVKPAIDIQSRRLIYAIDTNNRILAIAVNPMLLSLISLVHFNRQFLPRGRTVLYSQCIELLIDSWERTKDILSTSTRVTAANKEAVLREIAFSFQVKGKGEDSRENLEQLVNEIAHKLGIAMPAKELLEDIEMRSGLLVERSIDVFGFSHLTLQEYLVAKHIQSNQIHYRLLTENFDGQEWREVILLYTGLVDDATGLIEGIASSDSLDRQVLAGYCIGDAQHCDEKVSEEIVNRLIAELCKGGDRSDEIVNVMSAVAADFRAAPMTVEERLSARLTELIEDRAAAKADRLQAVSILGRARVTRALPSLIDLMNDPDKDISAESIKAVTQFGNLALPALEEHALFKELHSVGHAKRPLESIVGEHFSIVTDLKFSRALLDYAWPVVEVLSGINTGQAARQLIKLYDWQEPALDLQVSVKLSQMMTNTFVEADLYEVEAAQLPRALRNTPIDRNGWSYSSVKSGFWHIDTKLRADVLRGINGAAAADGAWVGDLAKLHGTSFKILFPALLSHLRSFPEGYVSAEGNKEGETHLKIFENLGFDETAPNKIRHLVTQLSKSFSIPLDLALQNINGGKTSDYSYKTSRGVKLIMWVSNIYFTLFYILALFCAYVGLYAVVRKYVYEDEFYQGPSAYDLILLILILPFYAGVISVAKRKLKQGYLTKKFVGLVLFPIANFLKVLPYLTRQRTWVKLVVFQLLVLCCSLTGEGTYLLISELAKGHSIPRGDWWFILLIFYLPGVLFLLTSTLYWKYYVLSQNPVFQLMLLHPQGRRIAKES